MKRTLLTFFPLLLSVLLMLSISSSPQKGRPKPPPPPPPPADPAIVYVAERSWATTDLMVMNADGSNQKVLLASNGSGYHDPSWSPDSSRIAFCLNHEFPSTYAIYMINKDGSGACKVVDMINGCVTNGRPQWSPDGSKILYSDSDGVSESDLFLVDATCNANPSNKINLTQTPETSEFHPAWSPDGSRVAAVVYVDTQEIVVYNVNADWTHATLGPTVGAGFRAPKWPQLLSDSNLLAASNGDVGIIDLATLDFKNLTGTLNTSESWPAWSFLDDKIIFGREGGLWVVSTAGGSAPTQIAPPPTKQVRLNEPDWRHTP